jgi:hypothetical protein
MTTDALPHEQNDSSNFYFYFLSLHTLQLSIDEFAMFMFNKLWLKSFGTTRQVIDMVLGAPADLRFEHPAFAALAALQLLLALRARHTMGAVVGLLTTAMLSLKYTSIDLAELGFHLHVPQYARLFLAAYVVVLLVIRLLTIKSPKGETGRRNMDLV